MAAVELSVEELAVMLQALEMRKVLLRNLEGSSPILSKEYVDKAEAQANQTLEKLYEKFVDHPDYREVLTRLESDIAGL